MTRLQACASFCLISQSCLSFQYSIERVDCIWFPSAQFDVISGNTGYWFYTKNSAEVTSSYDGFFCWATICIFFIALTLLDEWLFLPLSQCFEFAWIWIYLKLNSLISYCQFGNRKSIQPVRIYSAYPQSFLPWDSAQRGWAAKENMSDVCHHFSNLLIFSKSKSNPASLYTC